MNKITKVKSSKRRPRPYNAYEHKIATTEVVPDSMSVTLPYYEYFALAGSPSIDHLFLLNSIFDVNYTGSGHQPLGYDQWDAFFNRYRVTHVDVEVEAINNGSLPVVCVIQANNYNGSQNTLSAITAARESPFSASKFLGPKGGSDMHWKFRKTYRLDEILGISRSRLLNDDTYSGVFGASPAEGVFLHLMAGDPTAANVDVSAYVRLRLHSDLFDRDQLVLS